MITVHYVAVDDIDLIWPEASKLLETALSRGGCHLSLEDIYDQLFVKTKALWVAYDENNVLKAALIASIEQGGSYKFCHILLLGGETMYDWEGSLLYIEEWARDNGCEFITADTRKGIVKRMKSFGFHEETTRIRKSLQLARVH